MTAQRKKMLILTGTFLAILASIAWSLVQQGRYDYAQNIAIKIVFWVIYTFWEVRSGITISNYIRASVMAILISDSYFGLYLDYYVTSSIFDKVQHVFGSYVFSLFAYSIICKLSQPMIGRGFTFIFILTLGLSMGAIYEVGEFLGDSIAKPSMPSQPNLLDTDLDLIADIMGSLLAAVHVTIILVGNLNNNIR
ncbi:hypothetical protein SOV_13970 [Sporomusa ovata DSM 2662]|uniref:Uncharacterized protein n=1 Tax=Sporomusa ovata TaxID=2378 RepID=A0A0U1KYE3_9FIRM|nr:hypothetical protein [Sporomusa ovata]EQB29004.1 hypothetical protein SOV_1c07340 [Sporomusa ovata DSM 2662]CQR72437.1 hypothetical protein SpAn4DRAFT_2897 [Sporomusa ovata]